MWRFLAKSFFGGGKLQNFRHTSQISSLVIVQTTFYQTFTYFLTSCLGPKKPDFWPKINILEGHCCALWIQWPTVCQKFGMILEKSVSKILRLNIKKILTKKKLLLNYYFWLKKNQKNSDDSENSLWKSDFITCPCIHKIQWFSLKYVDLYPKIQVFRT